MNRRTLHKSAVPEDFGIQRSSAPSRQEAPPKSELAPRPQKNRTIKPLLLAAAMLLVGVFAGVFIGMMLGDSSDSVSSETVQGQSAALTDSQQQQTVDDALPQAESSNDGTSQTCTVGVLQSTQHESLDEVYEGIIYACNNGWYEEFDSENVELAYTSGMGDIEALKNRAQQMLLEDEVDLIIAIGTPAAQAAQPYAEEAGIPLVFAACSDPVAAGLVESWEQPGGLITGICDILPADAEENLLAAVSEYTGMEDAAGLVGSLFDYEIDYFNIGANAFGQAEYILYDEMDPADIPVRNCGYFVTYYEDAGEELGLIYEDFVSAIQEAPSAVVGYGSRSSAN